jgi:putative ABC transport system permease protein
MDFKGWFSGARTEQMTELQSVLYRVCTPDYMRAMGIRLIKGRQFTDGDTAQSPAVALVNETMARQFWPNQDPIGRRLYQESSDPGAIVVGVVADVKQSGLDVPPKPEFYVPHRQTEAAPPALVIRTAVEPLSLAATVRREIRAVDKEMPITDVQTMEDIMDRKVFQRRLQMLILAFFAGSALLLSSIGIYGVLSYLVAQRKREIGLRMALGAASSDILKNVFGQAAVLVGAGLAIGLVASVGLTRMMSHLLFGVTATDPATFIGVPLLLFAIGLTASYIPARRAMKVDPSLTLRDE